jgi:hypothetical protein
MSALPPHERGQLYVPLSYALASLNEWYAPDNNLTVHADARIPVRAEAWPVNMGQIAKSVGKERLAALRADDGAFDDKAIAALNYANGMRTVSQIARLVAGEAGPFTLAQAAAWFDLLGESGVVAWSEKEVQQEVSR